jgi:excisionase family DNA binding protein
VQDKEANMETQAYKTVKQLCDENQLKKPTVHQWIKAGKLKTHRFGAMHRIYLTDWAQFLEDCNAK